MPAYTGPVPPTPTGTSSDAVWQSWWAYQNILRDLRFEDERIARAAVLDRQHTERIAAESACAAANQALAKSNEAMASAQRAVAEALAKPSETRHTYAPRTRADLVWEMVKAFPQVTSMTELTVVQTCERLADAYLLRHPQG
jgi:hypothetical protein